MAQSYAGVVDAEDEITISNFYLFRDNQTSWKYIMEVTYEKSAVAQDTLNQFYNLQSRNSSDS